MRQNLPLICNGSNKNETVTGGSCHHDSSIQKSEECDLQLLDASTPTPTSTSSTPVTVVSTFPPASGSAVASSAATPQPPPRFRLAQANSADCIVHNTHLQLLRSIRSSSWSLITCRISQRTPRPTANRNRPNQLPFRRGPCDSITQNCLICSASSPPSRQNQTKKTFRVLCRLDRQLPDCNNYHRLPCHCALHTTNRAKRGFEAVSAASSPFQRLHTLSRETINQLNSPP